MDLVLPPRPAIEVLPKLVGIHRLRAFDEKSGKLVYDSGPITNLIVNAGKQLTLQRAFGLTGAPVALAAIGLGTDSTAAAVGQTQLNPSVAGSVYLQAFDTGGNAPSLAGQTVTCQTTFGTGVANFTINEAAIFNGTTNGTSVMFNRVVIGPFAKTSAVTIVYSTQITQS